MPVLGLGNVFCDEKSYSRHLLMARSRWIFGFQEPKRGSLWHIELIL